LKKFEERVFLSDNKVRGRSPESAPQCTRDLIGEHEEMSAEARNIFLENIFSRWSYCALIFVMMLSFPACRLQVGHDETTPPGGGSLKKLDEDQDQIPDDLFLTLDFPSSGSFIHAGNHTQFQLKGKCSESGQNVLLLTPLKKEAPCKSQKWEMTLNLSETPEGELEFSVKHSRGTEKERVFAVFFKDTIAPPLAVIKPEADQALTQSNTRLIGLCESGLNVHLSAGSGVHLAKTTLSCSDGTFSADLNLSGGAGIKSISLTQTDEASNQTQITHSFLYLNAQKIQAGDSISGDDFGLSISSSGEFLAVGAPHANDHKGAVYLFQKTDGLWQEKEKLLAPIAVEGAHFGAALSLKADLLLVGAPGDEDGGDALGAAYLFEYNGVDWVLEEKLTASDAAGGDEFGVALVLSEDRLFIASPRHGLDAEGALYFFAYTAGDWVEAQKLTADDAAATDLFGSALAVHENTLIIGAPRSNSHGSDSGAAYLFTWDEGLSSWQQEGKFTASDASANARFGNALAVSESWIAIGAYRSPINSKSSAGAVYLFEKSGADWAEADKLSSPELHAFEQFGKSISLHESRLAIGAWGSNLNATQSGATYLYTLSGSGGWEYQTTFTPNAPSSHSRFGASVCLLEEELAIGAFGDQLNSSDHETVYLIDLSSGL
jgi:hypothetical protein